MLLLVDWTSVSRKIISTYVRSLNVRIHASGVAVIIDISRFREYAKVYKFDRTRSISYSIPVDFWSRYIVIQRWDRVYGLCTQSCAFLTPPDTHYVMKIIVTVYQSEYGKRFTISPSDFTLLHDFRVIRPRVTYVRYYDYQNFCSVGETQTVLYPVC